jgi:hypothetical protein
MMMTMRVISDWVMMVMSNGVLGLGNIKESSYKGVMTRDRHKKRVK